MSATENGWMPVEGPYLRAGAGILVVDPKTGARLPRAEIRRRVRDLKDGARKTVTGMRLAALRVRFGETREAFVDRVAESGHRAGGAWRSEPREAFVDRVAAAGHRAVQQHRQKARGGIGRRTSSGQRRTRSAVASGADDDSGDEPGEGNRAPGIDTDPVDGAALRPRGVERELIGARP